MENDAELLLRFARDGEQTAFAEIVRRHLDFVYQTALRQLGGDAHHAADVAQYVFVEVARKASSLAYHRVLKGWLFSTACHAAANIVRAEKRRHRREQEAHAMQIDANEPEISVDWAATKPLLNDALTALSARDREAVLLRYFEGRDYAEIGARFSVTADAARLRVERALDKMRAGLSRAGLTSGAAALAGALTAQAGIVAPAGLATSVTTAALAGATATSGLATAFLILMNTTKIQGALLAAVLLTGSVGLLLQQRSHARLADELADLSAASKERVKLQIENRRLASRTAESPDPLDAELAQMRRTAEELNRQLAEKNNPSSSLAPGLVPTAAWKNVGQATLGEAYETLQWARSAIDVRALGKLIAFASGDREKAEDVFARLSEKVRTEFKITTAEEMVGFLCAMIEPLAGAAVTDVRREGADDVIVRTQTQRLDGREGSQSEQFHHASDGWRWVIPTRSLHHGLNEISKRFLSDYPAFDDGKR